MSRCEKRINYEVTNELIYVNIWGAQGWGVEVAQAVVLIYPHEQRQ